ncbi:2-oxo-4-hydroxy-4-carboxy-5-ureidoimidazoline decarboxylase [Arthrobacter rhizosphaerae]|uniref:2-oxo-4-hydroxy-4-carboxy-5-ureidoimidazoline decarboxylase n=1 Tax=Arthrobacter rhizosphaerae TaxID=2855490 RepID=UPI001FF69729|nr:2-oxo-4-hydroxy-4-carboxy-5-ureidoimidazoline decarboxylase [Arthrobacter rhizosphaerae]
MQLAAFNALNRGDAVAALRPCLDVDRWLEQVADARPFPSLQALMDVARTTANPFTNAEVQQALSHHPRIGERPTAKSAEASMSRSEQAGVDPADVEVARELAEGNRQYEEKFGQVFLIRAAGRTASEILAALRQRLTHTPDQEQAIIAQQLREIAVLRVEGVISE